MGDDKKNDIEQMKELFAIFQEKVPGLLNSLTDVLYGKSSAEKYGLAVANFYRTLKDSGMTDEQAFKLTEQYMSSLNLGKIIGDAVGHRREGKSHKVEVDWERKPDEE